MTAAFAKLKARFSINCRAQCVVDGVTMVIRVPIREMAI
jgi:hypothetical protein